jgi:peptidoglycan/LPS O-acetylase OafA/YrhL
MAGPGAGNNVRQTHYLDFVDGLRAIAIIAVVGFHTEVPGFGGGFVGVDVFFVISGFLIINQIRSDLENDKFSILSFYARRTLRILPPLIVMLVAVYCAAPFILPTPKVAFDFAMSAVLSPTVASNIYFFFKQGYFDLAANQKPLLHTWTLAVEEQFYFVVPALLMAIFYFGKKKFGWPALAIAVLLAVVSWAGAVRHTTTIDRNPAFYLMHWRAWEFIAGGVLVAAVPALKRAPRAAVELLGLAGLAAIIFAVTRYDARMAYPSWHATVPVAGATLLILAGLAQPQVTAARLLGTRPITAVGLVSYSWYLWHWPILSLMRIERFGEASLLPDIVGGGALALLLAWGSYRYVEQPIRGWGRRQIENRKAGPIVVGGLVACLSTALLAGVAGFGGYFVTQSMVASRYGIEGHGVLDNGCRILTRSAIPPHCLSGGIGMILGDSHADALSGTLTKKFAEQNITLVSLARGGCSPLWFAPSQRRANPNHGCSNLIGPFSQLLALPKPLKFAIIDSTWVTPLISGQLLAELVSQFDLQTRVLVIGPVPLFAKSSLDCVILSDRRGDGRDLCTRPRSEVEAGRQGSIDALRTLIGRYDNVRLIDPIDLFCDATTCRPFKGDQVFYLDDGHVTPLGAERIYDSFSGDFQWLTGPHLAQLPAARQALPSSH